MPHKEIDSGLGFCCDEGIVELVRMLNRFPGIKTAYSCQGGDGPAYVVFVGSFDHLKQFCMRLRPHMSSDEKEMLYIHFQPDFMAYEGYSDGTVTPWAPSGGIRGHLEFDPSRTQSMIQRLEKTLLEILGNLLTLALEKTA